MLIIKHRCNLLEELSATPIDYGCEIDLRNHGHRLTVCHDAFDDRAIDFEDWLMHYNHKFLIVNVKEEGLEEAILPLLKSRGINSFFILDESFPYIMKWAIKGVPQFALRVSEFESIETPISLAISLNKISKSISWVWVDTFLGEPLPLKQVKQLKDVGFKICYVSPELHSTSKANDNYPMTEDFICKLMGQHIIPDAVCTKVPNLWSREIFRQTQSEVE